MATCRVSPLQCQRSSTLAPGRSAQPCSTALFSASTTASSTSIQIFIGQPAGEAILAQLSGSAREMFSSSAGTRHSANSSYVKRLVHSGRSASCRKFRRNVRGTVFSFWMTWYAA